MTKVSSSPKIFRITCRARLQSRNWIELLYFLQGGDPKNFYLSEVWKVEALQKFAEEYQNIGMIEYLDVQISQARLSLANQSTGDHNQFSIFYFWHYLSIRDIAFLVGKCTGHWMDLRIRCRCPSTKSRHTCSASQADNMWNHLVYTAWLITKFFPGHCLLFSYVEKSQNCHIHALI